MSKLKLQISEVGEKDSMASFAEVLLPVAVPNSFTYRITREMEGRINAGQRVVVQFGKNKIFTALVISIHKNPPKDYQAKYILDILDESPIINEKQFTFWKWLSEYYCCTLGEV